MVLARAALAGREVELEVGVAGSGARDRFARGDPQRCAPEVRVHDDAGGVEHAPERRAQARAGAVDEVRVIVGAGQQLGAALGELGARDRAGQAVDGRQRAQALATIVVHVHMPGMIPGA